MKASQLKNIYLGELVAGAIEASEFAHMVGMKGAAGAARFRKHILPDLASDAPEVARAALEFTVGFLKGLGYDRASMGWEAANMARRALRRPDPVSYVVAAALARPLGRDKAAMLEEAALA